MKIKKVDDKPLVIHTKQKEGLVSKYRKNVKESNQSIKVKNHSLRSVGMAGGKAMMDQMEGGQELQQASMIIYEACFTLD